MIDENPVSRISQFLSSFLRISSLKIATVGCKVQYNIKPECPPFSLVDLLTSIEVVKMRCISLILLLWTSCPNRGLRCRASQVLVRWQWTSPVVPRRGQVRPRGPSGGEGHLYIGDEVNPVGIPSSMKKPQGAPGGRKKIQSPSLW